MKELIGTQLGDYRVVEEIGAGGMGRVYLAENVHHGKRYALKVLPAELSQDESFRQRFFDEARVMNELNHEHIVRVHHMGEYDGTYYLVMDYVTGPGGKPRSLHQELAARTEKRVDPAEVRRWVGQIAAGLAYAHKRGVVHRDIKPGNLMLTEEGDVKITDFGLAKAIGSEFVLSQIHQSMQQSMSLGGQPTVINEDRPGRVVDDSLGAADTIEETPKRGRRSSESSGILGTYDYMSPEQREPGSKIDQRSDIYSLGVMIYRMLTGKRPAARAAAASRIVIGLSKNWDALIDRCLADEPAERYGSADELLKDLVGRRVSGKRVGVLALALLVLAGVLGGAWYGWGAYHARQAERKAAARLSQEQAQQVAAIVGEARNLLAQSDLDGAEAKIAEALAISPEDEQAKQLRQEVENKAGERKARSVKVEADMAWEGLQGAKLDGGQGFAQLVREAEAQWRLGQEAYSVQRWGEAYTAYREALRMIADVNGREQLRRKAKAARQQAQQAGNLAEGAEASKLADKLWRRAGEQLDSGDELLEQGKFIEADKAYQGAAKGFADAQHHAKAVTEYRQSQTAYEEALARADKDLLGEYGGMEWQEVQRAARLGAESASDPIAGRQQYEKAREELPKAIAEAEAKDGVFKDLRKLIKEKERFNALLSQARTMDNKTDGKEAVRLLDEALELDPNNSEALALRKTIAGYYGANASDIIANSIGMKLVWIPPGEFMMGSPLSEAKRSSNEGPQHRARISKGFWMAQTEVTQSQWQAVMGNNRFKGDTLPVEQVSWEEAVEFCTKLSQKDGKTYMLPTEAQWEYACRAGTTTPFNTGETISTNQANYDGDDTYGNGRKGVDRRKTIPVGSFRPNDFGLYDMHGNVEEWCGDWYESSYYATSPCSDPSGPTTGTYRVLRGGSWCCDPRGCRSAHRLGGSPDRRDSSLGFRVVVLDSEQSVSALDSKHNKDVWLREDMEMMRLLAEQEKRQKFDTLLSQANAEDSKATGKEALRLLDEALALYPNNSEALALKKKITGYYAGDVILKGRLARSAVFAETGVDQRFLVLDDDNKTVCYAASGREGLDLNDWVNKRVSMVGQVTYDTFGNVRVLKVTSLVEVPPAVY